MAGAYYIKHLFLKNKKRGLRKDYSNNPKTNTMQHPESAPLHFDSEKLKSRIGNNQAIYLQFITLLQTTLNGQITDMIEELKACIDSENFAELRSVAHKIKGISLSSSFEILAHLSSTLEKETDNNKKILQQLLQEITDEVELLKKLVV